MQNNTDSLFIYFLVTLMAGCTSYSPQNRSVVSRLESQADTSLSQLKFSVKPAVDWNTLFVRNEGWFGGDGIFAIPLNGVEQAHAKKPAETMLVFSDSMIGEIGNGQLKPGYAIINNTVAYLKGIQPLPDRITFHWDTDQASAPKALFMPATPKSQPGEYYWLGDGFVNTAKNNDIYLFAYRIKNTGEAVFGFQETGNALIVIPAGSKPPFKNQRQLDTPLYLATDSTQGYGSFGGAIFVNTKEAGAIKPDGNVYVYGVRGKTKGVMVARVRPADIENFDKWRFWDGTTWNADIQKVSYIADRASNEMSISVLPDGRYVMVFQTDGFGRTVGLRLAHQPQGPFGPVIHVWDCSEDIKKDKDYFPYNAKVHSSLSQPGELLISYNINSFDFLNDIATDPHLYRPRFIRVKIQ